MGQQLLLLCNSYSKISFILSTDTEAVGINLKGPEFPTCLVLFLKGSYDTNEPFDKVEQNFYSDTSAKDDMNKDRVKAI